MILPWNTLECFWSKADMFIGFEWPRASLWQCLSGLGLVRVQERMMGILHTLPL